MAVGKISVIIHTSHDGNKDGYTVYGTLYKDIGIDKVYLVVQSKTHSGYEHWIKEDDWRMNGSLELTFSFEGDDYDVTKPMTAYCKPRFETWMLGWSVNISKEKSEQYKKYPLDGTLTYVDEVVDDDDDDDDDDGTAVTTTKYVKKRKADGDLWEFPFDGASSGTDVLLQTRPMKLDSDDLKGSYRVVLRGLFVGVKGKSSGLYVSGSIDGKQWMYLGGTERKHTGVPIRDIGTTVERNSCRFLMVVFVGCLLPESRVEYFDITTADRYTEKPR